MKPCCLESAKRYLKKHGDVAACDACGNLLLAYGKEGHFEDAKRALSTQGTPFEADDRGPLRVISKPRLKKK
jgi:hypothetical protein